MYSDTVSVSYILSYILSRNIDKNELCIECGILMYLLLKLKIENLWKWWTDDFHIFDNSYHSWTVKFVVHLRTNHWNADPTARYAYNIIVNFRN